MVKMNGGMKEGRLWSKGARTRKTIEGRDGCRGCWFSILSEV